MAGGPVRGAVRAAQRDPLDRHPRFDGRLSGAGRRRGGGGIPRDVRIVPAARAAAGRARHGAGFYAQFVSYSLEDQVQARARCTQSAAAFPPNRYFGDVDGPFRSFAHVSIIHGLPDDDGAFKSVLERMCHWDTVATPQGWRRWPITTAAGVSRGTRRAQQLLDRAAVLAQDQADDDFNVLAAAAMLWDGGDHEQGYFLTRQLADRRGGRGQQHVRHPPGLPRQHAGQLPGRRGARPVAAARGGRRLAAGHVQHGLSQHLRRRTGFLAPREPGQGSAPASRRTPGAARRRWRGCASACCCATTAPSRNSRKACAPICVRWWTRITTGARRAPAPRSRWPTRTGAAPGRIASPPSNGRSTPAGCSPTTKASTRSSRRC